MLRFARYGEPWRVESGVGTLLGLMGCTRALSAGSSTASAAGRANRAGHDRRVVPPGPIATDPKPVPTTPPPSVSYGQSPAVPPPGFLNTDWRSSFEDSNP